MTKPITLTPFLLNMHGMGVQLGGLLDMLYEVGQQGQIEQVRLITRRARRRRPNGDYIVSEPRNVNIFHRDPDQGHVLRRSHHDIGNNLMIAQYRARLRIVTAGDAQFFEVAVRPGPARDFNLQGIGQSIAALRSELAGHLGITGTAPVEKPSFHSVLPPLPEDLAGLLGLLEPVAPRPLEIISRKRALVA